MEERHRHYYTWWHVLRPVYGLILPFVHCELRAPGFEEF